MKWSSVLPCIRGRTASLPRPQVTRSTRVSCTCRLPILALAFLPPNSRRSLSLCAGRWFDDTPLRGHGSRALHCRSTGRTHGGVSGWKVQLGLGVRSIVTVPFGVQPGQSPALPVSAALHGVKVLVVDDHTTQRHLLQSLLGSWSMRPTLVESGPAALEALRHAE